jgi:hypothetical protein
MSKFNKTTLQKLERIFDQLDYKVRYEKGNFQSGYCMVEDRKIAVINKFFDVEGRANTMLEILSNMDFDRSALDETSIKLLDKLMPQQTLS